MSMSLCLSVCLSVDLCRSYLRNDMSRSKFLLMLPVARAALQYVMYFRFCGRRHPAKSTRPTVRDAPAASTTYAVVQLDGEAPVSYTHLTLPTIYSV